MDAIERNASFDVTTLDQLAAIYQAPRQAVLTKQTDFITPPGQALIEASPFLIMATATEDGIWETSRVERC